MRKLDLKQKKRARTSGEVSERRRRTTGKKEVGVDYEASQD
jgi:hypothetical protein